MLKLLIRWLYRNEKNKPHSKYLSFVDIGMGEQNQMLCFELHSVYSTVHSASHFLVWLFYTDSGGGNSKTDSGDE